MYRATYAISGHSSKQWPLQCWEQFSSCPFISRRRCASACRNWLSSPEHGPYLQCHIRGGSHSSTALGTSEPSCAGKAGTWHFQPYTSQAPAPWGSLLPCLQVTKWQPPLLNTNSARNQVFPHIMLKNKLPSLPETTQPGTESSN